MPTGKRQRSKKPTERMKEVKSLLGQDKSIEEIASLLETTPSAIYQQMSRMRSIGFLPPGTRGKRPAAAPRTVAAAAADPGRSTRGSLANAVQNGHSLEEHLDSELGSVTERLRIIEAQRVDLEHEAGALTERRERLEDAQKVLVPA